MVGLKNNQKHDLENKKYTKVYLKKCRGLKEGCIHKFFTEQPNKQFCSAWCRRESVKESWKNTRRKQYRKNKKRENSKNLGTIKQRKLKPIITHIGSSINFIYESKLITYLGFTYKIIIKSKNKFNISFYSEWLRLQPEKNETFRTGRGKGKQKNSSSIEDEDSTLEQYQWVTIDDLYFMSTSYLKENSIKCPKCGSRRNIVERGLLICDGPGEEGKGCGLVLKAPVMHPGFTVPDFTPKKKICATVQDFPRIDFTKKSSKKKRQPKASGAVKEAHENAYQKYEKETGLYFDESVDEKDKYADSDPMNPEHWKYYKDNKIYNKQF